MLSVIVLLMLMSVNLVLTEEQHCSKYDFVERILEKLVKMEFDDKQKQVEFERIKSNVVEALEKTENFNTNMKNVIDVKVADIDVKVADMDEKVADIDEKVAATATKVDETVALVADNTSKVVIDLEKKLAELEKQIMDKLHTKQDAPQTIVFKARLNSDMSLTSGQTIVYPLSMFNVGNGYDTSTGIFTSPVNGTYIFDIVICPFTGKYVQVAIVVNDEMTTSVTFHGDAGHPCSSANAIVVLQYKQKVRVKVMFASSGTVIDHTDSHRWNTFSGALI